MRSKSEAAAEQPAERDGREPVSVFPEVSCSVCGVLFRAELIEPNQPPPYFCAAHQLKAPWAAGPHDPEFWTEWMGLPCLMPYRLAQQKSRDTLDWRVLNDPRAVAGLCRQLQQDAGFNNCEMARRLGVDERLVRAVTTAHRPRIAVDTFVRWVEACGGNVIVERVKR